MRVALTYDDGPSADWTGAILALLAERGAHATFFVLGDMIPGRETTVAQAFAEGHAIGNHTTTHTPVGLMPDKQAEYELRTCNRRIQAVIGHAPSLWRAPYGGQNVRMDQIAAEMGLRRVDWTVDPGDWGEPHEENIAERVIRNLHDRAIVDLHDGIPPNGGNGTKSRQPTVDATRRILAVAGVEFVTVSELL